MHGAFKCLVIGINLFWFNAHIITQIYKNLYAWGVKCLAMGV